MLQDLKTGYCGGYSLKRIFARISLTAALVTTLTLVELDTSGKGELGLGVSPVYAADPATTAATAAVVLKAVDTVANVVKAVSNLEPAKCGVVVATDGPAEGPQKEERVRAGFFEASCPDRETPGIDNEDGHAHATALAQEGPFGSWSYQTLYTNVTTRPEAGSAFAFAKAQVDGDYNVTTRGTPSAVLLGGKKGGKKGVTPSGIPLVLSVDLPCIDLPSCATLLHIEQKGAALPSTVISTNITIDNQTHFSGKIILNSDGSLETVGDYSGIPMLVFSTPDGWRAELTGPFHFEANLSMPEDVLFRLNAVATAQEGSATVVKCDRAASWSIWNCNEIPIQMGDIVEATIAGGECTFQFIVEEVNADRTKAMGYVSMLKPKARCKKAYGLENGQWTEIQYHYKDFPEPYPEPFKNPKR